MAGSLSRARSSARPSMGSLAGGAAPPASPPPRPATAAAPPRMPPPAPLASKPHPTGIRRALAVARDFLTKGRAGRRLRGRVVSRAGDTMLVELTAEGGPVDWIIGGAVVTVSFADGTLGSATILVDRSTREGTVPDGATARVALQLGTLNLANASSVTFELAGVTLVVVF